MPTSYKEAFSTIAAILASIKPNRVLDLGIGFGKYGLAAREYGEAKIVDGVEVYEPYVQSWQKGIYDNILIQDMRELTRAQVASYDLTLMIDVIEHMTKEEGLILLNRLDRPILISTPIEEYYGKYENHYENHVSHWAVEDFSKWPHKHYPHDLATIVLLH